MNIDKQFFSKIGFSYLIYGLSTVLFQIILFNIIGVISYDFISNYNHVSIVSSISNYILPLPILLFVMKEMPSMKLEKHDLNLKTILLYISITFTLMWIGNIIGLAITYCLEGAIQTTLVNPVNELVNSQDIWANLLLISIMGPIFEELIFRKLLIDRTIKYGMGASILISATLFGLMHGNLFQLFYAFLMGAFFAYVYIKTGKVIYPIILHIIINFFGSVVSVFVMESANKIVQGAYLPLDLAIVSLYTILIFIFFIIGLIGLLRFKKNKLEKLKVPLKSIYLNPGMLGYIGFCILLIIIQII